MIEVDTMGITLLQEISPGYVERLATSMVAHVSTVDGKAVGLWAPELVLRHQVVRAIVAMQTTPFKCFNGVQVNGARAWFETVSMIWGDFELYTTGKPTIKDFYAVPGKIEVLEPDMVAKALAQLKELKEAVGRCK